MTLSHGELSAIAHAAHPVAAPLSDASVAALLDLLPVPDGGAVVDVGCGGGEWLVRLLARRPSLTGTGVDLSPPALAAADAAARAAGVDDRVVWVEADGAAPLGEPAAAALCVGSAHVFDGLARALEALAERVVPGGAALVGDGFWEPGASAAAREVIGELADLPGVVAACEAAGWSVVGGHVSSADEWDAYEWSWTGTLTAWALDHPGPAGDQARALAREHREGWLTGYRGQLGFVTLVLRR